MLQSSLPRPALKRSLAQRIREKVWRWKASLDWGNHQSVEHLGKLDTQSMGPGGMWPRVLREPVDMTDRPLLTIFERLWQSGEEPEDQKKVKITTIQKGQGECRELQASQPHIHLWKGDGTAYSGCHL